MECLLLAKVAPLLVPVGVGFSCLPPGVEGEGAASCVPLLLGEGVVVLKIEKKKKKEDEMLLKSRYPDNYYSNFR